MVGPIEVLSFVLASDSDGGSMDRATFPGFSFLCGASSGVESPLFVSREQYAAPVRPSIQFDLG